MILFITARTNMNQRWNVCTAARNSSQDSFKSLPLTFKRKEDKLDIVL